MGLFTQPLPENECLVCGTCGDEGFTNAFVYCVKCLEVAIHRYCLDEMPKTFHERVVWCCEHCQVKASSQSRKKEDEPAIANNGVQDDYYICAQPVINTVWRGSFTLIGAKHDSLGLIFAHLSTTACDKVFQEAEMMPSLLHLEMHPKLSLWPKSFQEREPSDDSIALYFFPGDPINEIIYDHLVQDMMDKELAMSAPTVNAELLIFTSMVLPHVFRRFHGKYYLWGVFRNKRDDPTSVVSQSQNPAVPNSNDQQGLLKRVDVVVQPFVEPVDNPMS